MHLNDAGHMVQKNWIDLPQRFPHIALDEFVIMPNHFHGIVALHNPVGTPLVGALDNPRNIPTPQSKPSHNHINNESTLGNDDPRAGTRPAPTQNHSLGQIIGAFKSMTTHDYIAGVHHNNWQPFHQRLWQLNYYEHIIRNNDALQKLQHYITQNPECWDSDQLHPNMQSYSMQPHPNAQFFG